MHGHELRRLGRINEAIARFEAADKLQREYLAREKIPAEFDWHHAHNLDLLAASYQYTGQMRKAEALLKQSFNIPTNLLVQAVNKREWPEFLIARNRPAEALAAAKTLLSHPNLVVQATGHIEAGAAALAMNRPADGAASSNAALKALRSAQGGQGLAAIALEALQGEFLLRTAQRDKGRSAMERAAQKWRGLPGPDAWTQSLFRLEALARTARSVGDWPFAARMAQLMLEHDPNYGGTHFALGLVSHHETGTSATTLREFALAEKAWANADKDLAELKQMSDLTKVDSRLIQNQAPVNLAAVFSVYCQRGEYEPASDTDIAPFSLLCCAARDAQRDRDDDRGPRDTETVDRTLAMPAGGTLRLKTFSGRVRITGGSGNQMVLHAIRRATKDRLNDIKLEITQSGSTIEVDANHRLVERRNDNVVETDFEIQVPAGTRLDIKTFSAPVTVIGVTASQNIDGFSSDITIESTDFGDGNDIDVNTFSGDVRLRLPATAKGNIDFNSFSGRFESDLPVTLNTSSRRNFRGALNGGGSGDFRLKTFSGDVTIRR